MEVDTFLEAFRKHFVIVGGERVYVIPEGELKDIIGRIVRAASLLAAQRAHEQFAKEQAN